MPCQSLFFHELVRCMPLAVAISALCRHRKASIACQSPAPWVFPPKTWRCAIIAPSSMWKPRRTCGPSKENEAAVAHLPNAPPARSMRNGDATCRCRAEKSRTPGPPDAGNPSQSTAVVDLRLHPRPRPEVSQLWQRAAHLGTSSTTKPSTSG